MAWNSSRSFWLSNIVDRGFTLLTCSTPRRVAMGLHRLRFAGVGRAGAYSAVTLTKMLLLYVPVAAGALSGHLVQEGEASELMKRFTSGAPLRHILAHLATQGYQERTYLDETL